MSTNTSSKTFSVTQNQRSSILASVTNSLRANPALGILLGYLLVTFVLTHANLSGTVLDHKNFPGELSLIDKVYHFVSYSILTFLVLFAFTTPAEGRSEHVRLTSAKRMLMWCVFVVCYGIFDEATQPFFHRNFEVFDLLANCFGIALGQLLFVVSEATGIREKLSLMR